MASISNLFLLQLFCILIGSLKVVMYISMCIHFSQSSSLFFLLLSSLSLSIPVVCGYPDRIYTSSTPHDLGSVWSTVSV